MIRVHQKNKRIATESSVEEFETREKATKSSKVMIRTDACEDCREEKTPKRSSASSAALRILQSGANSSRMLRDKLTRKGYSKEEIEEALDEVKTALGKSGRIVVRPSGTEPLIRVMVEGSDIEKIRELADEVSELIRERLGAK